MNKSKPPDTNQLARRLDIIPLVGVFLSLAFLVYAGFTGISLTIPWEISTTYSPTPLFIEYFRINGESVGIFADQFINWQTYTADSMKFLPWTHYLVLLAFVACFGISLVAITYVKRTWYFIAATFLIAVVLLLKPEELLLWNGKEPYLFFPLIIGYLLLFKNFKPSAPLKIRSLTFLGIMLICSLLFLWRSNGQEAILRLTAYGFYAPVLFCLVCILLVAGENIHSILKLTTQNNHGKSRYSLWHFSIFGLSYITLLILFFLDKIGQFHFEMAFINPVTLFIISCFSAFFSFKRRFLKYEPLFPQRLVKSWLLPLLYVIAFILIGFAQLTGNDPLLDVIEYAIIISHLAFGATYFVYALINFGPMLVQNMQAFKVFYKPIITPLATANLTAVAFIVAMLFYLGFYPLEQLKAGCYNVLGDFTRENGNPLLSEQYYLQGVNHDFQNFKSSYQVSFFHRQKGNAVGVVNSLKQTFIKHTSDRSPIALSNYYQSESQAFNAFFALKEAIKKVESPPIRNNLAVLYHQFNYSDSAYALLHSNVLEKENSVTRGNLSALSQQTRNRANMDSIVKSWLGKDNKTDSNLLAFANTLGQPLNIPLSRSADTLLVRDQLFILYNACLNQNTDNDKELIETIDYYLSSSKNEGAKPLLLFAKAIKSYQTGLVTSAFELLNDLVNIDPDNAGYYHYILAIWSLDQGSVRLAEDYLVGASSLQYDNQVIENLKTLALKNAENISNRQRSNDSMINVRQLTNTADHLVEELVGIAQTNAFHETTVLDAIQLLKDNKADEMLVYDILLQAINTNRYSKELIITYIDQCVETGLIQYARSTLTRLSELISPEELTSFKQSLEQKIEKKRNQSLEEFIQ